MVDLKKAREIMITFFTPEPDYFEVWYQEEEGMYKSIAKWDDAVEIFIGIWDDDYDYQNEVIIDKELFNKIRAVMEGGIKNGL